MESKHLLTVITLAMLLTMWLLIMLVTQLVKKYKRRGRSNQTADIWNISGRVNHQDGPVTSEPHRWPTHDHHVSIDSFVMPENLQAHKKDRIPPPPYCEVDLPTYEQATGVPAPKNDLPSVHATPSSSRTS